MQVLTLVFALLAASWILAALQDSICIGRDAGVRSAVHQQACVDAVSIPIMMSGSAVIALLVWSAWNKQVHVM